MAELKEYVQATYEVPVEADLSQRAEAVAIGMTVGSWVDVPDVKKPHLRAYLGEVSDVQALGHVGRFSIRYPLANVRPSISALLTVVFGKLSLDGVIRLVDLELPPSFVAAFKGPSLGLDGLRKLLGIGRRPLIMSIFKSENGRTLEEFRGALKAQLDGGVDFVKDDEIFMADGLCPLLERIATANQLIEARRQKTGQRGIYFANLSGTPAEVLQQALVAQEHGATGFLLSPYSQGLDLLTDLRRAGVQVPLIAHPAFSGGQIRPHGYGISPAIYLGLLPRMAGADVVLFPSPYGSVALEQEQSLATARALLSPSSFHPRAVPGPSAGIHLGLVGRLLSDFGRDLVVNAGGAIHGHPQGTTQGARTLVEGVREELQRLGLWQESDPW